MAKKLPAHPKPPADLAELNLLVKETTCAWWRSHRSSQGAIFFGRTGDNRYDAPAGEYGILYLAETEAGAFVETYLRNPKGIPVYVSMTELGQRHFTAIKFDAPLRLVDLTGSGLARMGADDRLTSGTYAVSQQWALALWNHPERPDGILFRSRNDPEQVCCGVFDRRSDAKTGRTLGSLVGPGNATLLGGLLDRYGTALLP